MTNSPGSLVWRARDATDIPSLDAHHQSLFKVHRLLQESIENGQKNAKMGPILEFLEKYSRAHFEGEEAFMRRTGFPGTSAHLKEHSRFTGHLCHLKERFKGGDEGVHEELILVLSGWLKEHILKQDMIFAEHVRGGDSLKDSTGSPTEGS